MVAAPVVPRRGLVLHDVGALPVLLWLAIGGGATVSVPVTFQLLDPETLYLVLGVLGAAVALVVFVRGGCRLADDDEGSATETSMAAVPAARRSRGRVRDRLGRRGVPRLVAAHAPHRLRRLPAAVLGLAGVLVGALIGLVPGCAVQIVFVGVFAPVACRCATFVANTISQDGDALLPLLALEHRSALLATVLTTVPALLVGLAFLVLT